MTGPKLLFENEFDVKERNMSDHWEKVPTGTPNAVVGYDEKGEESAWAMKPNVEEAENPLREVHTPLQTQIGGTHYKKYPIQPIEYVHANGIGYFEGTAIKYLTRWKDKGGIEDLKKAIHFIELLIELEQK